MKELTVAKLFFWGVILFGLFISFLLFVWVGNWIWLIWGILVLIFILGSGLPLKIWLALQIKKNKKSQDSILGQNERDKKQTYERKNKPFYPPKEEVIITGEDIGKVRECKRREHILKKRGICVYLHNLTNIMAVLEKLFDLFEGKNAWSKEEKLSQEKYEIGKEVASYFYCATVNRIWGDQKWDLSEKDAYTVLDTASDYFVNIFGIENPNERLKEHRNVAGRGVESPLGHLSGNIIKLLREDNKSRAKPIQIQEIIRNQLIDPFLKGLEQISSLSEPEMDAMIQDFRLNFPHLVKINH